MGVEEEAKGRTIEDYKEQLRRDEREKRVLETVEALGKKIDQVQKQQGLFCDPKSGMCFLTRQEFEKFMREQTAKIPQILDGAQDLSSFFQKVSEEKPGGRLYKVLSERIPTKAKLNLIKFWCGKDEECILAIKNDPDMKIKNSGQRKHGLLGTGT